MLKRAIRLIFLFFLSVTPLLAGELQTGSWYLGPRFGADIKENGYANFELFAGIMPWHFLGIEVGYLASGSSNNSFAGPGLSLAGFIPLDDDLVIQPVLGVYRASYSSGSVGTVTLWRPQLNLLYRFVGDSYLSLGAVAMLRESLSLSEAGGAFHLGFLVFWE